MNPKLWRAIVLPLIIVAALFVAFGWSVQVERVDFGLTYSPTIRGDINVQGVDKGSQAAKNGIKAGDHLARADMDLASRIDGSFPHPGEGVRFIVNGRRTVTLVAGPWRAASPTALLEFNLVRLAFLVIAALLAWRRPDDGATRALVLFLFSLGFGLALNNHAFESAFLSFVVLQLGSVSLFLFSFAAAARFAAIFPTGNAPRLAGTLSTIAAVASAIGIAAILFASLQPGFQASTLAACSAITYYAILTALALLVAILVERYVHAQPAEKKRRLWIFLILGLGLLGPAVDLTVQAIAGFNQSVDQYASLTLLIIPIGLGYVILRHRLIDLNFVLNRAAVYALVSIVVVGVFVVVETLLAKYVETTSHLTSTAVQLAVALVLGFSIRAIHARADRVVDTILFRERHEDEAAIRTFAHDAPYITDEDTLLRRCVETALRYGHATAAGAWVRDADGVYEPRESTFPLSQPVGENDPAVLAMRARRIIADVAACGSALPGSLAFPMIVRGELVGILLSGPKSNEESYAPDERDALEAMAMAVGHGLDALKVRELELALERLRQPNRVLGTL